VKIKTLDLTDLPLREPFFFIASTRGKRYVVSVYQSNYDRSHGTYSFQEFTSGSGSGGGGGYSLEEIRQRMRSLIAGAARYDGINYEVYFDELGVFPKELPR